MKIDKVILPKMINYYIAEKFIPLLHDRLEYSSVDIKEGEIHLYMQNDLEVCDMLRMIISKTAKLTLGNQCVFEYEMDINLPDGHIFEFSVDSIIYKATLLCVSNLVNSDLHLVFKIIR